MNILRGKGSIREGRDSGIGKSREGIRKSGNPKSGNTKYILQEAWRLGGFVSTDEPPTRQRGNRKGLPLRKPAVGAGFTPALGRAKNERNNILGSFTVDFFAPKIMTRKVVKAQRIYFYRKERSGCKGCLSYNQIVRCERKLSLAKNAKKGFVQKQDIENICPSET